MERFRWDNNKSIGMLIIGMNYDDVCITCQYPWENICPRRSTKQLGQLASFRFCPSATAALAKWAHELGSHDYQGCSKPRAWVSSHQCCSSKFSFHHPGPVLGHQYGTVPPGIHTASGWGIDSLDTFYSGRSKNSFGLAMIHILGMEGPNLAD